MAAGVVSAQFAIRRFPSAQWLRVRGQSGIDAEIAQQPVIGNAEKKTAIPFPRVGERAGIEFVLDCRPVLADIDPAMWETIMLNLLSNAVKYTMDGSIMVAVRSETEGPERGTHITLRLPLSPARDGSPARSST